MYQIDFNKPLHIHFIGIGGISMSGLAEILLKEGFPISGSQSGVCMCPPKRAPYAHKSGASGTDYEEL